MIALLVLASIIVLGAAYLSYGKYLSGKLGLDATRVTLACSVNDGVDFVPAKAPMLVGQHFSAIAAAGRNLTALSGENHSPPTKTNTAPAAIPSMATETARKDRWYHVSTERRRVSSTSSISVASSVMLVPKGATRLASSIGTHSITTLPLRVYLSDGRLPIDNNDTEQLMKHVAIGRKNWLFVGSVAAGERAADFLTLVSSAVRNDLDVWAYIKDVLDRLLAGSTNYESLRPDIWRQAHPESIRQYRVDERRDRADRKQRRRADRRQLQG